jgi:hypothetical protein
VVLVEQLECTCTVGAGLLVMIEPGMEPAHAVEHLGFVHRVSHFLIKTQGMLGVGATSRAALETTWAGRRCLRGSSRAAP